MLIFLVILVLLINRTLENFLNDKLIGYQQCGNLVNTYPTFLKCNYLKNIINTDIKSNGINIKKPLQFMNDKNKKIYKLNVNTYRMNRYYKKENPNCKTLIDWIMEYCRFKL